MTKQNENRVADSCNAVPMRSEADSNRCTRFADLCLATRPSDPDSLDRVCKYTKISLFCKTSGQLCIFIGKNLSLQPLTEAPKRVRNLRFRPKEAEPNSFGDCRIRKMKREIPDIALTLTPGIGPKGAVHLLDVFGSAEAVFSASADELTEKPDSDRNSRGRFSKRKRSQTQSAKSNIAANTGSRSSPPPTHNTRPCCAKPPTIRIYCMSWAPRKRSARRRLRWSARAG